MQTAAIPSTEYFCHSNFDNGPRERKRQLYKHNTVNYEEINIEEQEETFGDDGGTGTGPKNSNLQAENVPLENSILLASAT